MTDRLAAEQTIRSGYFDRNAFRRRSGDILVLKTGIAGLQFSDYSAEHSKKELEEELTPGTELFLFRDADNPADEWAIAVYTSEDQKLGYVTRFKNETIARLMDHGKVFHAYIDEPEEQKNRTTPERNMHRPRITQCRFRCIWRTRYKAIISRTACFSSIEHCFGC